MMEKETDCGNEEEINCGDPKTEVVSNSGMVSTPEPDGIPKNPLSEVDTLRDLVGQVDDAVRIAYSTPNKSACRRARVALNGMKGIILPLRKKLLDKMKE